MRTSWKQKGKRKWSSVDILIMQMSTHMLHHIVEMKSWVSYAECFLITQLWTWLSSNPVIQPVHSACCREHCSSVCVTMMSLPCSWLARHSLNPPWFRNISELCRAQQLYLKYKNESKIINALIFMFCLYFPFLHVFHIRSVILQTLWGALAVYFSAIPLDVGIQKEARHEL